MKENITTEELIALYRKKIAELLEKGPLDKDTLFMVNDAFRVLARFEYDSKKAAAEAAAR